MGVFDRLRSATCSTARPSVLLIFSPENIFFAQPDTSASAASACSSLIVSSVMMFLEKSSKSLSSKLSESLSKRAGSLAKRSRTLTLFIWPS